MDKQPERISDKDACISTPEGWNYLIDRFTESLLGPDLYNKIIADDSK